MIRKYHTERSKRSLGIVTAQNGYTKFYLAIRKTESNTNNAKIIKQSGVALYIKLNIIKLIKEIKIYAINELPMAFV
jgi:hypothetical protein